MTSEDLTWTPTSVTIVVEGKEYVDYKPGMEWIVYALEFFRLSKLHKESIKLIKQSGMRNEDWFQILEIGCLGEVRILS